MAGFWFSKIELFAGSPSEKRLRWRVTFFPDERDGPRLSLSPLDTFDGLRAGMLGAARRARPFDQAQGRQCGHRPRCRLNML
jgi:hypothetical protein